MWPKWLFVIAILPAILVAVVFEVCLGHRHDYAGHFAAGYGATFAAAMFCLRLLADYKLQSRANWFVVPFCIACIIGGAAAEASAFRIAKFDEIDFCNQSIGAVLASLCASAFIGQRDQSGTLYEYGLVIGIAFLGIGGCLAVA